ncbi:MAG: PQQ-binding-like beta-propeller repeat protein [Gammaproteobacteria bacterium]
MTLLTLGLLVTGPATAAEPDGKALFDAACAYCHDRELPRMPSRAGLKEKDPRDIYTAISAGVMAPYARALSHGERRAVAEYAAGRSLGDFASGAAAIPPAAYCKNKPAQPLTDIDSGWNGWGNDLANTRFQDAARAGLDAADVAELELQWAFGVPAVSTMSGHPTVADGRLFFGTFSGLVIALDAASGCALWVFEADGGVRTALTLGRLGDGTVSLFFGDLAGKVYAVDPETGTARWSMVADTHPHIRITGTPVYHDDRLYVPLSSLEEVAGAMPDYECCTFRGGVLALDAASGRALWKTHTIAEEPSKRDKNAVGTQRWAPSGAAVWTAPTLDPAHNRLYIVTGDSYSDPAAPESDAVMALAMDSGQVLWTTQTLAGDAYTIACMDPSPAAQVACPESKGPDLDFGSAPALVELADGRRLLLAGQKSGWLYALDPASGKIVWQTEVGEGGIVGGIEWGFAVDDTKAYVAIAGAWEKGPGEAGGISAVNLTDGSFAWEVPPPQDSCTGRERCNTGQLAAVTALPGVVFSGSLDGYLRAYDSATGEVIWAFDTHRSYDTVNGVKAQGGSINGPGPAVAGGMVYVNSGYGMWNKWMPGNALLAFGLRDKQEEAQR